MLPRLERLPWVVAHRGASRDRPENTFAAFDEALRQGCDGFELDVQLSRDGVPVVYHDRTLTRAGGGRRRVSRVGSRELARLDAGARFGARWTGQRLPLLQQVLERYGGRTHLFVEVKARRGADAEDRHLLLARTVARLIRSARLERRSYVLSFDPSVLAACTTENPRIRPVLNLRPPARVGARLAREMAALHAVCADVRTLGGAFAAAVRRAGLPLFVYTCNTPRTVRAALAAGAAAVITDRPGWLAGRLRRDAGRDGA
jgi:glycerophosphoryl diester phosphodiesterase